ncbi:MAG: plasmid mobilization relaxosome protein MobC [Firmicutes bacterium]|nr:plasmid mobilization relaxosome protein MobC [Bacillota bacterium]
MADKKDKHLRTERVNLRLTKDELAFIKKRMKETKFRTYSDFVLKAATDLIYFVIDVTPFLKIAEEVCTISRNINQVAKVINITHSIYESDITKLQKSVHNLEEIIDANLNKVYRAKFGIKRDKRIKDIRLTRIGYVKILNVFEFLGNRAAEDKKEEVEVFIKALSKEYENFVM